MKMQLFGRHDGDLLPLDLCLRLNENVADHPERFSSKLSAHHQNGTNVLVQSLTQTKHMSPLTPSPSSTSSQDNEDDMGYCRPSSQMSILRQQPVQVFVC